MFIDLTDDPKLNAYSYFVNSVTPRPIAWVSTVSEKGITNIAPYSFFTVASCLPAILSVTHINPRDKPAKDTLINLMATKECVVNIVSQSFVEKMNASSANFPTSVSEFSALDIEPVASTLVKAPGALSALVRYECELKDVISFGDEPGSGKMLLLNVKGIFVNDEILKNNVIAPNQLATVGKMGGDYFSTTKDLFSIKRP
ncbi:flavin reductase family protein [Pseudoalteromonas sp. MMG010]|uniref:flavin reductase family protein n=1 Tax=Pseudoalteromonas sp. MMG010 TaxID=2822685 RepID=UPI001B3A4071|nr:flavin reductase family protein [Pseudoalteromonas sp. MMG010]MBQ4833128.1 flavin reductase family protein [Pseudoalteromonas sp. MMG010]